MGVGVAELVEGATGRLRWRFSPGTAAAGWRRLAEAVSCRPLQAGREGGGEGGRRARSAGWHFTHRE